MSSKLKTTLTAAIGAALLGSVAVANAASAFQLDDLGGGYMLVGDDKAEGKDAEGKCGEGKCGGEHKDGEGKDAEGKCGEGKCGGEKGKEGSCGGDKGKEGSCGGDKGKEGSCGGSR